MSDVERVVAVDWSGDKGPGQKKKIWAGVWTAATGRVTLESGRTRTELCDWLVALAAETPRMVVGIDFCFSYPAWFLEELGCRTVFEFWQMVADGWGERWLSPDCGDARFWGRAGPNRSGKKPAEFAGRNQGRMMRRADESCKISALIADPVAREKIKGIAPKSPFQIGGAGAVGTGSLRGIPILQRLHRAGFRVWPFEANALHHRKPSPLVLEIYPRLLTGAVKKSSAPGRAAYLDHIATQHAVYKALAPQVLADAHAGEDAFDALVSVIAMARHRASFLTLKQADDATTQLEGAVWGTATT